MLDKLLPWLKEATVTYPSDDLTLPFSDYLQQCRNLIQKHHINASDLIVEANSPYAFYPLHPQDKKISYGALLIHGMLDCPFSLKEIAQQLRMQGILAKSILLPGHGLTPGHLLNSTYHDWLKCVNYGVESMRNEVEHLFLIGFSLGGVLALRHALTDKKISGIIQIAPAMKITAPLDLLTRWRSLTGWLGNHAKWIYLEPQTDYSKYLCVPLNAVFQLTYLVHEAKKLSKKQPLSCPLFMILSENDETVISSAAVDYFSTLTNPKNQLLLYTPKPHLYKDKPIIARSSYYSELSIEDFSHISLPFSSANPHYGNNGDSNYATRLKAKDTLYGAYNPLQSHIYAQLYQWRLARKKHKVLTFNPDFDFLTKAIMKFIFSTQSC